MPPPESTVRVTEIMSSPAITIQPDATLADAARLMLDHKIGCLPVVDADGMVVGILTERSFFPEERGLPFSTERVAWLLGAWVGHLDQLEKTVREVREQMVAEAAEPRHAVAEDTLLSEVAAAMLREGASHLVVEREGTAVGVVSRHDLVKVFVRP